MSTILAVPIVAPTPDAAWLPRLLPGILRLHRTSLVGIGFLYLAFTAVAFVVVQQVGHPRAVIDANQVFNSRFYFLAQYAVYLPILTAAFVGAPMISRSIETGTYRFAWTQSIGRRRLVATTLAVIVVELTALSILLGLVLSRLWFVLSPQFGWNMWEDRVFFSGPWMMAVSSVFGLLVGALLGVVIRHVLSALAATIAVMFAFVGVTWNVLFQETLNRVATRKPTSFLLTNGSTHHLLAKTLVSYQNTFLNSFYADSSGHQLSSGQLYNRLTPAQRLGLNTNQGAELRRLGYHEWSTYLFPPQFHEFLMTWLGLGMLAIIMLVVAVFARVGGNDRLLHDKGRKYIEN
jgi:ABC-type transport system involved in multi-copper enzyme maturation permease subunit